MQLKWNVNFDIYDLFLDFSHVKFSYRFLPSRIMVNIKIKVKYVLVQNKLDTPLYQFLGFIFYYAYLIFDLILG